MNLFEYLLGRIVIQNRADSDRSSFEKIDEITRRTLEENNRRFIGQRQRSADHSHNPADMKGPWGDLYELKKKQPRAEQPEQQRQQWQQQWDEQWQAWEQQRNAAIEKASEKILLEKLNVERLLRCRERNHRIIKLLAVTVLFAVLLLSLFALRR